MACSELNGDGKLWLDSERQGDGWVMVMVNKIDTLGRVTRAIWHCGSLHPGLERVG